MKYEQTSAPTIIKERSTESLIEMFITTGGITDPEVYTVRGWIMDELEARNPEAFDKWLEDFGEDEDLPKYFS